MHSVCYVWGTGSLSEKFVDRDWPFEINAFVDPNKTGSFLALPVISPEQLAGKRFDLLVISSSFVSEIAARLGSLNIDLNKVFVFKSSVLELIPLSEFVEIQGGKQYHLPWRSQLNRVHNSLSSDIVFPDVYQELAKSVGYAHIASVEGDLAEFGTCSGFTASLIAYSIQYYSDNLGKHETIHGQEPRKLHLFDSFEGFPESTQEADINSPHVQSGAWGEGTARGLNEQELVSLCSQFLSKERIKTYPGWYKDTLQIIEADTRFAFVHIDCDLYESTIDVLKHLFSERLISEGAILLFDNWFCNRASDSYGEQRAWSEICSMFEIQHTNLGMYACVGNRIVVHDYNKRITK